MHGEDALIYGGAAVIIKIFKSILFFLNATLNVYLCRKRNNKYVCLFQYNLYRQIPTSSNNIVCINNHTEWSRDCMTKEIFLID